MKRCPSILIAVWFACTAALAAQDALSGDFSKPPAIEKRLAEARAELRELPATAEPVLREQLQQLEAICQYHLAAVDVASKAQAARDEAARATAAWNGYPKQTPRTLLLLDEVRERLATVANSRRSGEAQLRIITAQIEGARDRLTEHQQAARRFAEAAAHADTAEARQRATDSVKIEEVASRAAAEGVARLNLRMASQQAEIAMLGSKAELAELQLKALDGKPAFPRQDLDATLQRIATERAETVAALAAASHDAAAMSPLLAWKIEFLDLERKFWETRFAAFDNNDAAVRKRALVALNECKVQVDDWIEIGHLRLSGGSSGTVELDPGQLREMLLRTGQMQRRIGFAIADLEGGHLKTPILDRISSSMGALWNTELYLAEETEIVDGKKISTYRAVTLGKLIRLACILTVGWLLLRLLSRRVKSIVSHRSRITAATADLASKWAFALGLALLVLYGLNTVRIPLTALAFLGGALAIGVGFGTQTLLKNFISGIILLFERPLRVGDLVEVDGVTGTIRTIGMRSSVIHHGNGIDSIIPNSTLLENKLTNWTLSDTLHRHTIKVGVAYGSSTREVAKTLLAVADEHGLVLKQPAPEVRFESFGEKALNFALLYWFDIRKASRDALASDLHFMIEKAFAEAGLRIAGAQNEVTLDSARPLRVEISRRPKTDSSRGCQM